MPQPTDYNGLLEEFDLARGHIVPYFVAGGDRNGDGYLAAVGSPLDLAVADIDDACTGVRGKLHVQHAPQLHSSFNGSGGLWHELETRVRQNILGEGQTVHVIAGTVFGDGEAQRVGPRGDIQVPDMLYKILISEPGIVAFLFAHAGRVGTKGCALEAALKDCIVTVVDIEALTGLDFFAGLDDRKEALLEGTDGHAVWAVLLGP